MRHALRFLLPLFFTYASTNPSFAQWVQTNGLHDTSVHGIAVIGNGLFAGTLDSGVFKSTDYGANWIRVLPAKPDSWLWSLIASPGDSGNTNLLIASSGSAGGIFRSIDYGTSWTSVNSGLTSMIVQVFAVVRKGAGENDIFAGTTGCVFLSSNNGTSWNALNSGLTNFNVHSLAVVGTDLFAGTDDGVWTRPLSEMITGVRSQEQEIPSQCALEQNYPNPFNPTTVISYQLPMASRVNLTVYDVLGREVAMLMDQRQSVGTYSITFDAGSLPSGVYFYRLQAGAFTETKKLMLLK